MDTLLISACLMGFNCKYSGGNNALDLNTLAELAAKYRLIPVCPEFAGGLPTPRDPSERVGAKILSRQGADVTGEFQKGAETALTLARRFDCKAALLKECSPSCGSGKIYDGSFSQTLVPGDGLTAQGLKAAGITIIGESEVQKLI